jgi:hypothetical protein
MIGKVLVFKETEFADDIFIVKCSMSRPPMLFRLILPIDALFSN